ncbi:MAG: DUF72 domain-containing protein [Bacteroidota bacterium]|nr:DUF72 domain-containing protein [Bacteroidota bacterium]MDP4231599.1 DUF72 domain-containing protein [Bacteroidota bacterium]MDP4235153.1 DUF72 domain-containing protein [Bacteroidota bacterium]
MNSPNDFFDPARDIPRLHELARKRIYLGTSSWKYEGWLGQVYHEDYHRILKGIPVLNKSKFDKESLSEYATVFPTVCNDSMYYRLPELKQLEGIEKKLPPDFKMTFKCPESVTLRQERSFMRTEPAEKNEYYLDPKLFAQYVLAPIRDVFKEKLGAIIFEFSPFFFEQGWGAAKEYDYEHFVADLDKFLGAIPAGYEYAVEVRDPILIHPGYDDYLTMLRSHKVAHVINAQTWMPPIEEQIKRPGIVTTDRIVIRALTKRGVKHEAAVKRFEPYTETLEPMPDMRRAIAELMMQAEYNQWLFEAYVNNRTEGNAPNTIHGILNAYDELKRAEGKT